MGQKDATMYHFGSPALFLSYFYKYIQMFLESEGERDQRCDLQVSSCFIYLVKDTYIEAKDDTEQIYPAWFREGRHIGI